MRPGILASCLRGGAVVVLTSLFLLTGGAEARARDRGQGPPGTVSAGPVEAVDELGRASFERGAAGEAGRSYHPDRLIVQFHPGRAPSILPGSGAARPLRGGDGLFLVPSPPGLSVAEAVRRYARNPDVLFAEPDYTMALDAEPNDERWSEQWNMVKIAAPAAWETQTSSSDVVVAVLDSGINFSHPDLQANVWTDPLDGNHGFTCLNGTVTPGGEDDHGHGTHVAGIVGAAGNNGLGVAGTNWSVQLLSLKAFGSNGLGNVSDAVLCIDKLTELRQSGINVRVSNHSWSTTGFSQALADAMARAESAGVLHVCAAGNSARDLDIHPSYPAAFTHRGLLAVSATDSADAPASFTNQGHATVDLAAPGVDVLSAVPSGTCARCDPSGFKLLSGTSMATPHVSGVAAALFHLNPLLTPAEARDALLDPASFDALPSLSYEGYSTTRGRLSFARAIANPRVMAPQLNGFPVMNTPAHVVRSRGNLVTLSATTSDPDGDALRHQWAKPHYSHLVGAMINNVFGPGWFYPPVSNTNPYNFIAPALARTATARYLALVNDGRGGSATGETVVTVLATPAPGQPPSGTIVVTPESGPPGTVVTVSYSGSDPEGSSMLWGYTSAGGGTCCYYLTETFTVTLSSAGVYRFTGQAIDRELNLTPVSSVVVRIGDAMGEPPVADLALDVLSGPPPLTVSYDATGSYDPDGQTLTYYPECAPESNNTGLGVLVPGPPTGTCTFTEPGPHTISVLVKDAAHRWDQRRIAVMVTPEIPPDTNAPTAAITYPISSSILSGSTTIQTDVSDDVGVVRVDFYRDSGVLIGTDTTSPYSVPWSASPGDYTLYLQAHDQAGNIGTSAAVPVTVLDTVRPAVALTAPASGATVGGLVPVEADASDDIGVVRVEFYRDSGTPLGTDTTAPYGITWNSATVPLGTHTLYARAFDRNNFTTSATVTVTVVDLTPPSVAITSPTSGGSVAGAPTLRADASDNVGVVRVEFYRDAGILIGTDTSSPFTTVWGDAASVPGPHTLYAQAYDQAGNSSTSATVPVTSLDVVAPTVAVTSPASGASLSGLVTVSANASDNVGVTQVEFFRDAGIPLGTDTTAPYEITWNTSNVAPGAYTLYARASDQAINRTTSASVPVTVADVVAPTVSLASPTAGSSLSGSVAVYANATDNVGVVRVEFYRDAGILLGTDTTASFGLYDITWNSSTAAAGAHTLYAKAYDQGGNVTTSAAVNVTVLDTTPPTVAITSPANGGTVAKNTVVTIQATASDDVGVTRVELYVGTTLACTDTTSPYTCAWTVPKGASQQFSLQARAYDAGGNVSASAVVRVTSR
jgi:subtilisin family serine protease